MPTSRKRIRAWAVAASTLAVAAMLLLLPVPKRFEAGWRSHLLDFGHVPLFAAITVALWFACGRRWLLAAILALILAGLVELIQPFTGRSGNFPDFLRGGAGVLAATALLRGAAGPASRSYRLTHALFALALVAVPAAEVTPRLLDAAEAYLDFPVLADFDAARRLGRWECRQADLRRAEDPDRLPTHAGRVEFQPGPHPYPSISLQHVCRDFTGYRRLCWSFTVEGGPLTLVFSLRGGPNEAGDTSHHQFGQTFGPGDHVATMDLNDATLMARPTSMDIGDLWWSQLFIIRPSQPRVIRLWRVWVE